MRGPLARVVRSVRIGQSYSARELMHRRSSSRFPVTRMCLSTRRTFRRLRNGQLTTVALQHAENIGDRAD